jgi:N-methylhydantoinase B
MTLCTNHCAQEIAEAVIKALAPACPDRVLAGWGRRFRIAIQGKDPRTGRPFIWHMFHARPGGGASPAGDGWPTAGEGQAAGGIKFGSVEVTEVRFPLFFKTHEFRPDSGGAGKYRGGVGSVLELHAEIAEPAKANTAGDGIRHAPYGILAGRDGLPHRYRLRSRGRPDRALKTKEVGVVVRPGDVFLVESAGGGGYGDPRERDAAARAADLENAFVTRNGRARRARGARSGAGPSGRRAPRRRGAAARRGR